MILTFHNLDVAWTHILGDIINSYHHRFDSRAGECREILGYSFRLSDPRFCVLSNPARKWKSWYAGAELLWYLGRSENVKLLEPFAPRYREFATPGTDIANGAYGRRWVKPFYEDDTEALMQIDQLERVIELLRKKPETRQAIVSMWMPRDLLSAIDGAHPDLPCTLSLIFTVRDGRLNLQTIMRSNDAWLGTSYDVFCFCCIQMFVARACGLQLGHYTHFVNSMHLYERNYEKAVQCVNSPFDHQSQPLFVGGLERDYTEPTLNPDALRTYLLEDVVEGVYAPQPAVHSLFQDIAMLCDQRLRKSSSTPLHLLNPQLGELV